ncbi:hypothetical protein [Pararhizobium sp.]|uniref:hypothetical protein n=1 Tax=Pararhizobium sp. TaxID=1977563 RepID=UPI0027199C72|nr:hypothetical protein [Pararhizobium sp.]MDO9418262.1 hypothetical protein [Pararhizobium sp.]
MIKLLFTGLWVCAVTLGSVYFSLKVASTPPADPNAEKAASEEYIAGELVTVPVLGDGVVDGYFLAKLSFAAEKDKLKEIKLPVKEIVTDELYTILIGNKVVDIRDSKVFDLETFKSTIRDALNKRLNADVIKTVLVEQLEYVAKAAASGGGETSDKQAKMTPEPIIDKNGVTAKDTIPVVEKASGH